MQIEKGFLNNKLFYRSEDRVDFFFEPIVIPKKSLAKAKVSTSAPSPIDKKVFQDLLKLFNDLVLLIDSDRNFVKEIAKDGIDSLDVKSFKNGLYDLYINADKNETFNQLISFLGKFNFSGPAVTELKSNIRSFPFNADTDIGFAKFGNEIEVMLKNESGKLPLKNFGTGVQQFLFLLAKIHFNKSRIVIIEEIELNLSPLYQKELLQFLKTLMPGLFSQLHFSSHSPYFTQKNVILVDIVQHVQIDYTVAGGTSVDSHTDIAEINDIESNFFYFN